MTTRPTLAIIVRALAGSVALAPIPALAQHGHHDEAPASKREEPSRRPAPERPAFDRLVEIAVTERGFEPAAVAVKKGEMVRLVVRRKTDATPARELVLDEFLVWLQLPLNEPAVDTFRAYRAGEFRFSCADGKVTGVLRVDEEEPAAARAPAR